MFNRTNKELPRTNNAAEGWHRSFQANVATYHPTFWKFIGTLKNEESLIRTAILQNQGGHQLPPQRRRYIDRSAHMRILDDYHNRQRMD